MQLPKKWNSNTRMLEIERLITLPRKLSNSHLKIDAWKTTCSLALGLFSRAFAVGFREGII